jgi:hypothetical protein
MTIAKTMVNGREEDRTVKRTIDGERADLQLKWAREYNGNLTFVHIHCMKDKGSSEWSRTSWQPMSRLYTVTQKGDTSWDVLCNICGRKWNSGGSQQALGSQKTRIV